MFKAPDAAEDEIVAFELGTVSNFWLYCMSNALIPRLFSDFEADACVVVDKQQFISRVREEWNRSRSGATNLSSGPVRYDDPVGAYAEWERESQTTNFFTKTFRYVYQNEFRFVGLPRSCSEDLGHIELELGPLDDIGELIVL